MIVHFLASSGACCKATLTSKAITPTPPMPTLRETFRGRPCSLYKLNSTGGCVKHHSEVLCLGVGDVTARCSGNMNRPAHPGARAAQETDWVRLEWIAGRVSLASSNACVRCQARREQLPLPREESTTQKGLKTFVLELAQAKAESGLDWLMCFELDRQR